MLEAVQAVHDQNVVHTDLKPANFVLVKGKLKIIDFGIAKAIANDTVNIHRDTQVSPVSVTLRGRAKLKMSNAKVHKVPNKDWSSSDCRSTLTSRRFH
jgi:serine/threonine-protein kinase TTK/MPS1